MKSLKKYPFLHTVNTIQKINATTIQERLGRGPHQLFLPHRTDFYMIFLFTEGHGSHTVDFNTFAVKPKHILFIGKGQVHHFDQKQTYDGNTVVFTEDFFCRTEADRSFLQHSPLFNDPLKLPYFEVSQRYQELLAVYNFIIAELNRPVHTFQADILHHYLYNMMLIAQALYNPNQTKTLPSRQQQLVSDFKWLSNQYLHEQWTINQYAEKLNVTPRTLQTAFSQLEETSPKAWLNDRMSLEIKRLLTYDSLTINEIAFQMGFKEATNFVKFFKTHAGTTPSEFRRLLST